MPVSFTDEYRIDKKRFRKTSAFDAILDVDTKVFIDPALLDCSDQIEFKNAKGKVDTYFSEIIALLVQAQRKGDKYWNEADSRLTFSEFTGTCIGYSQASTDGHAIGSGLRKEILLTIKKLVVAGEKDPTTFKVLGVFQKGIGCDRISDILTFILIEDIMAFTQRVIDLFDIADTEAGYYEKRYRTVTNKHNNRELLLLPECFLSPLPVADDYFDIDVACGENERVRKAMNDLLDLGRRKKLSKAEEAKIFNTRPDYRNAVFTTYRNMNPVPYNFAEDPVGEYAWYQTAKEYIKKYPLELELSADASIVDVYHLVQKICEQFKALIEDRELWRYLFTKDKKPKRERAAKLLFYGVADEYFTSNGIALSYKIYNSRGYVDFKLSQDAVERIRVEVKNISNSFLQNRFKKQIPVDVADTNTYKCIYPVIDNGNAKGMRRFIKLYESQSQVVKKKITYLQIDGALPEYYET